jgi:hypothetical protein
MIELYKVGYQHPNWGWSLYRNDLNESEVNDCIIALSEAGFTDAYGELISPLHIKVYRYGSTSLVKSLTIS